mmetsp:Transcript_20631/g.64013  ORF Transcript_20631/g.64013 Transcript_20631/m.64013 type:complete len:210 (-) Transcript_20631:412-1041(-)
MRSSTGCGNLNGVKAGSSSRGASSRSSSAAPGGGGGAHAGSAHGPAAKSLPSSSFAPPPSSSLPSMPISSSLSSSSRSIGSSPAPSSSRRCISIRRSAAMWSSTEAMDVSAVGGISGMSSTAWMTGVTSPSGPSKCRMPSCRVPLLSLMLSLASINSTASASPFSADLRPSGSATIVPRSTGSPLSLRLMRSASTASGSAAYNLRCTFG